MKNTSKFLKAMRSIAIAAFVAAIVFSFTACPESGSSTNKLTITGLGSYNDKYAFAPMGGTGTDGSGTNLVAVESIDIEKETMKGVKISGGKVTLKVFQVSDDFKSSKDFTENGAAVFMVGIGNKEDYKSNTAADFVAQGTVTATFNDGSAEAKFLLY